jgi:hypothetical protein
LPLMEKNTPKTFETQRRKDAKVLMGSLHFAS